MDFPNDFGPIYRETIEGRFPVEPWNTYSNLLFLAIVVYWSLLIYKDAKSHRFLAFAIPVLFVGFVGGTLFHATRSHNVWLVMDFAPIMILTMSVSIHYMLKQKFHWIKIVVVVVLPFVLIALLGTLFVLPEFVTKMLGYPVMVFIILFPIVRWLYLNNWKDAQFILLGVLCFGLAISSRSLDSMVNILPMGTHWLWHSFGAIASHFLILYIYRDDLSKRELSRLGST